MKVVYEIYFGQETYGEVRLENNLFQCYTTPLFGGEFTKQNTPFNTLTEAIEYLNKLT